MLDWLIIGGGIHGTHHALVLTKRLGIPHERVRVLDAHPTPLHLWNRQTANVGMRYLRSPHVHNLHYDQGSLMQFARIHQDAPYTQFIAPFNRPSLDLFAAHNRYLIEKYRLTEIRIQGRAEGLTRLADGWRVETAQGSLEARRVLLAVGMTEQPYIPPWAAALKAAGASVHHIFDLTFNRAALPASESVVVVGGGITAAQTALALAQTNPITLVMRHEIRTFDFDSDPGWMNAIYLRDYAKITDFDQRRRVITAARHRGSLSQDAARDLQAAVEVGSVIRHEQGVTDATYADSTITLTLEDQIAVTAKHVILATGFTPRRPGGAWLDTAVEAYGLPTAACSFPIVDHQLCWAPGLHVTGALAELEVGPPARNIVGARLASQRIASAAR